MRVLHLYKSSLPESFGGVEQVIDQIARGTTLLGVENIVLALSNSPTSFPSYFHGYKLYTAKRNFEIASNGFSWEAVRLFNKLSKNVDVIHHHFPWPFADLMHQLVSPKKPTIVTYHSDIIRQRLLLKLYDPLKTKFLRSVDKIIATSPNYLQTSSTLKTFLDKTEVIPIGLDKQTYPEPDPKLIQKYKNEYGERFFLFIGSFRYYKGLSFLIQAAKEITFPVVIAGSGPTEIELKAYVQRENLTNIFFIGQISEENKSSLLKACYAVIFPSHLRSEAFGVTLLEGAMFQKPLISCEIGTGTTYVNIDQETGIAIDPFNPKSIAKAMIWLWNHPKEANEMGQRAGARFELLFTAERMAHSYNDLYERLSTNR